MSNNTVYKLYKYDCCYGDKSKRKMARKIYVTENKNMCYLIEIINGSNEGKQFTFCIEKFIDNSIIMRHQSEYYEYSLLNGFVKRGGYLSTTWEKYVWDDNKNLWRSSSYRYEDEKKMPKNN